MLALLIANSVPNYFIYFISIYYNKIVFHIVAQKSFVSKNVTSSMVHYVVVLPFFSVQGFHN